MVIFSWSTYMYLPCFWHPHCQFWHHDGSSANAMPFQRDPIDFLLSCLSQTKHSDTIPHANVLHKNTAIQILPTNVWLQKTLMTMFT